MTQLMSYEREEIYNRLVDVHTPWGVNILILWGSRSPSKNMELRKSDKVKPLKATVDKQARCWIQVWTNHSLGHSASFRELYRSYCLNTFCSGRDVINESRFSKLVIDTYKEKGLKVERRRFDNRISFSDLSFLRFPSPLLLICGSCCIQR